MNPPLNSINEPFNSVNESLNWMNPVQFSIISIQDFFDWRSGVFELPTTPEVLEKESTRLLLERGYEEYLKLSPEQKMEKVLQI
jgi:hypothetical protein